MAITEIWWCSSDGQQDNPLEDIHGSCTVCGRELVRIAAPEYPDQPLDGIAEHWIKEFGFSLETEVPAQQKSNEAKQ